MAGISWANAPDDRRKPRPAMRSVRRISGASLRPAIVDDVEARRIALHLGGGGGQGDDEGDGGLPLIARDHRAVAGGGRLDPFRAPGLPPFVITVADRKGELVGDRHRLLLGPL